MRFLSRVTHGGVIVLRIIIQAKMVAFVSVRTTITLTNSSQHHGIITLFAIGEIGDPGRLVQFVEELLSGNDSEALLRTPSAQTSTPKPSFVTEIAVSFSNNLQLTILVSLTFDQEEGIKGAAEQGSATYKSLSLVQFWSNV